MKDTDIDYSDIPALDATFFSKATQAWPPVKQQLTIRLDSDVLGWLKTYGKGYQTRINRILRMAMESDKTAAPVSAARSKMGSSNRRMRGS